MPFQSRPNVLIAEAELRPSEIQDLADQMPEIRKAAGAANLKFRFRVELDGDGTSPDGDTVAKLNSLLNEVSKTLVLK